MNGLASKNKGKQAKSKGFFLPCSVYKMLAEGVAQIKIPTPKTQIRSESSYFNLIKKNLTGVCSHLGSSQFYM